MHIIIESIIAAGHALLKPTVTMLLYGYRQNVNPYVGPHQLQLGGRS